MDVTLCACGASRTEAEEGKCSTDGCTWVGPHVGIAAVGVGAVTAQEMQAGGHSFGGGIMGEITVGACLTLACEQEVAADGHFFGVMFIMAQRAFGASTYEGVSWLTFSP